MWLSFVFLSILHFFILFFFFFNDTATTEIYTLSLHDALPICSRQRTGRDAHSNRQSHYQLDAGAHERSEEHTSELQSLAYLVCRLLLEKKKKKQDRCLNIIHHKKCTAHSKVARRSSHTD